MTHVWGESAEAAPIFSLELFDRICGAVVAAGYQGRRFDEDRPADELTFYMRHDVDISPRNALALGGIAARHGIRSNLFFQLNAETYLIFCNDVRDIMAQLRAMGHLVGLHIDQPLLGDEEDRVLRTIDWFNDVVAPIDRAISFHRPTPEVVGRSYAKFINAYDPQFFIPDTYVSDSRRSLAFLDRLGPLLAAGEPVVQLLLHPEWWTAADDVATIWQSLSARRQYELRRYVGANFTKVFSDVEAIEDRDFGI